MRVVTTEEIKKLEPKESIPSIRGTLTKIYPHKTGENAQGPWSMQNGLFRDSTGELKILFTNQPDAKGFLNREICVKSHVGDKGMSGVYAHDDSYSGTTTRIIKITATGDVSAVSGSASANEPAITKTAAVIARSTNPVQALKNAIAPILNACHIIEKETKKQSDQAEVDGIPFNIDNFGGKCGNVMRLIDPALVRQMPLEPLWSIKSGAEQAANEALDEPPF